MAWNGMALGGMIYSSITKLWNRSMGGWFMFITDMAYQVLFNAVLGDWEMAGKNLDMVLAAQTPQGNFAGLLSEHQQWVDRSQPPAASYCVLVYYLISGDTPALRKSFDVLYRANLWWGDHRDQDKSGLVQLGTSGNGYGYFTGQRMAAKDEASLDNSPMYDEAEFDEERGLLRLKDVGASALLALDCECLARIAAILGEDEKKAVLERRRDLIDGALNAFLWDGEKRIYANRTPEGEFGLTSPTSFYPLAAGLADQERLEASIGHIFDPREFWTPAPLPAINAGDPSIRENRYWRGRTWAPQNFWTYLGLRRCGRDREARRLAEAVMDYFSRGWERRKSFENYNPFTGEGEDTVDSDPFYSWTALLPLMWFMEYVCVDPWNGLSFGVSEAEDFDIAPVRLKDGVYRFSRTGGETSLYRNGLCIFSSDLVLRFKDFVYDEHYGRVSVCGDHQGGRISFPQARPLAVKINGESTPGLPGEISLAPGQAARVELFL
jgi:putative isomerase